MNVNFGLFPLPDDNLLRPRQENGKRKKLKGKDRKKVYTDIALKDLDDWINQNKKAA